VVNLVAAAFFSEKLLSLLRCCRKKCDFAGGVCFWDMTTAFQ
jgi:hypothetical protein